jgi:6-phosphogluconate dehydrogenase
MHHRRAHRARPLARHRHGGFVAGGMCIARSNHHRKEHAMDLGMIGLGRMGANMVRRLARAGHRCVVYDRKPEAARALAAEAEGARAADSMPALVTLLPRPRALWLMVPARAVESTVAALGPLLDANDVVIDGGNSHYRDSMARADALERAGIHYIDAGTSGGIWGLEHGYCLMLGGKPEPVARLDPIFRALAPGPDVPSAADGGATGSAARGYLHCGASGAGHFVKMIHNGIEYGMMAAYAEGMNLMHAAGSTAGGPALLRSDLDLAAIAELWRHGSVVRSWLLDLIAHALGRDPALGAFRGHVGDSGEGRWTVNAAVDAGVPLPVLSAALFARFSSQGASGFADKLLSAMRAEFGGHREPPATGAQP